MPTPLTIKRAIRKLFFGPRLSIIVVVYKMPDQAKKTLLSLSPAYQQGVFEEDYEVIVVENSSERPMGQAGLKGLQGQFRYFYREESQPTPVFAIDFAVRAAKGAFLSLIIDGARMASPGMVRAILQATRISKMAAIAVPGYHLGDTVQQEALYSGYNEDAEQELLRQIEWPKNGYKLFDIACLSATSKSGFFKPIGESNCLTLSRQLWNHVGGIDLRFTETGGGQANLDFYKRVCETPGVELILLAGEGTFHQFHGGVTTGQKKEIREKTMESHFAQYRKLRNAPYKAPVKEATIFGRIPSNALRFMKHSVETATNSTKREK